MSASEASDDGLTQYAPGHMPMPDFEALARDIQNRASDRVGAAATETRHFREFFGTSVLVVKKEWEMLERDPLLPEGCCPKHLHGVVRSLLLQRSIAFPTLYGVLVYWICNLRPTLLN